MRQSIVVLLLGCTACLPAADWVELRTTEGETIYGELEQEQGSAYRIRVPVAFAKTGNVAINVRSFDKRQVAGLTNLDAEYDKRSGQVAETSEAQLTLARWCHAKLMLDRAGQHGAKAAKLAPQAAEPAALLRELGWVQSGETWISQDDYLKRNGLARFFGRIIPVGSQPELTSLQAEMDTAQGGQSQARGEVERMKGDIAKAQSRSGSLERSIAEQEAIVNDRSAAAALAQAKQTLAAEKAKPEMKGKGGKNQDVSKFRNPSAIRKAEAAVAQAETAAASAAKRKESAEASLARLRKEQQELNTKRQEAEQGLAAAEAALAAATTATQQATQAFEKALDAVAQPLP